MLRQRFCKTGLWNVIRDTGCEIEEVENACICARVVFVFMEGRLGKDVLAAEGWCSVFRHCGASLCCERLLQ